MSKNSNNVILVAVSEKLGLQDCVSVIKKADEFLRILQSKSIVKTTEYAKTVLCLDLATSQLGVGFDKETAITISGLKKEAYKKSLNTVEKVLELDKPLSISEVCVQFSCTIAIELAETILEKYKDRGITTDINHPQYVAAAVYTACKFKNFKVDKSQFTSLSRLKPAQWKELESEFTKFAQSVGLSTNIKEKINQNELHTYLEEYVQDKENNIASPPKHKSEKGRVESYEDWKNRILKESHAALEMEEL